MATSSQATVLDLLVQKLNGLTYNLPASAEPVAIIDGAPGPNMPENMIAVMPFPEDESRGVEEWRDTSSGRDEYYSVQIRMNSYIGGGPDPNSLSTAQKQARTNATTMLTTVQAAILADINLKTENGGVAPIIQFGGGERNVPPFEISYSQTNIEEAQADSKGRYAEYVMTLNVYNYLSG